MAKENITEEEFDVRDDFSDAVLESVEDESSFEDLMQSAFYKEADKEEPEEDADIEKPEDDDGREEEPIKEAEAGIEEPEKEADTKTDFTQEEVLKMKNTLSKLGYKVESTQQQAMLTDDKILAKYSNDIQQAINDDVAKRLSLYDKNFMTEEEYNEKKQKAEELARQGAFQYVNNAKAYEVQNHPRKNEIINLMTAVKDSTGVALSPEQAEAIVITTGRYKTDKNPNDEKEKREAVAEREKKELTTYRKKEKENAGVVKSRKEKESKSISKSQKRVWGKLGLNDKDFSNMEVDWNSI